MPPYTAAQKQSIAQFCALTNSQETVATKFLKQAQWNLDRAVDEYYNNASARADPGPGVLQSIGRIFDEYQDKNDPGAIGIEGAMKFLGDIHIQLDEVACLGIMELCKCPNIGEFTRDEFITGWRGVQCDSIAKMTTYAATLRANLPITPVIYRRVYRYTFSLSRMQGQRNLAFDLAAEQWRLFFTTDRGGIAWSTPTTPWLEWWLEFLEARGKKPVNKDLWEQTEVFMRKTLEDESLGWWSADGAWPGTLDEFVGFVLKKRGDESEMEL